MTTPRRDKIIQFPVPRVHRFVLTAKDHDFLAGVIGPCHGSRLEDLLAAAAVVPGGRRIDGADDDLEGLLVAVSIEIHDCRKIEEERAGKPLRSPKRGGTVARLLTINDQLEDHLS